MVLGSDCVNVLLIIRERLVLTLNIKTRRVEGLSLSSFLNDLVFPCISTFEDIIMKLITNYVEGCRYLQ